MQSYLILFRSIEHSWTQSFWIGPFRDHFLGKFNFSTIFFSKIRIFCCSFDCLIWIVTNVELLNLFQVYRALMDAVVLDWTISLADKDRMKTCVVTYLAQEAKESTTIDPFMPKTRTFLLENLRPNHVSSKLFCFPFFWVT